MKSHAAAVVALTLAACAGASKTPFDANAANAAIARQSLAECSTGAPLEGHVTVVFAADGHVDTAVVDGGAVAGTPVAQCVERVFRTVRVAPFEGPTATARHSFRMR